MGYYTEYTLTVEGPEGASYRSHPSGMQAPHGFLRDAFFGPVNAKWYDHEVHLAEFSKRFPEFLFHLVGVGDEPGDMWAKTFSNGMVHHREARIAYDAFDASKLKDPVSI